MFAFYPHQDRFYADPAELIVLPPEVSDEQAVFLPNLETALGIVVAILISLVPKLIRIDEPMNQPI